MIEPLNDLPTKRECQQLALPALAVAVSQSGGDVRRPARSVGCEPKAERRRRKDQQCEEAGSRPVMRMTQSVYRLILDDLDESPFHGEHAGVLFGPEDEPDLVTYYLPDQTGQSTATSFTLDHYVLNLDIRRLKPELHCVGIVHSHPPGITRPSYGDLQYLAKLFGKPKNDDCDFILFPIVANGRLYPFIIDASDSCRVVTADLLLV